MTIVTLDFSNPEKFIFQFLPVNIVKSLLRSYYRKQSQNFIKMIELCIKIIRSWIKLMSINFENAKSYIECKIVGDVCLGHDIVISRSRCLVHEMFIDMLLIDEDTIIVDSVNKRRKFV